MLATVLGKSLFDRAKALVWWSVSLVLLIAWFAAIWPSFRAQPSMNQFLGQMPEAFRSLFAPAGADMSTPEGYIQIELMSFMAPMAILLYAVGAGVAAVAGEEDAHTLELLLSAPVGRVRIIIEKFGAMTVGTFVLTAVIGLALVVEGNWADMGLPADKVAAAMLHLALLGLVFGTCGLALSAATGRSGLSKGIPAAAAIAAYLVNGLGPVVDWLRPFQKYSPFYQYVGHDPLRNGVDGLSVVIALATTAALLAAAALGIRLRDTAA